MNILIYLQAKKHTGTAGNVLDSGGWQQAASRRVTASHDARLGRLACLGIYFFGRAQARAWGCRSGPKAGLRMKLTLASPCPIEMSTSRKLSNSQDVQLKPALFLEIRTRGTEISSQADGGQWVSRKKLSGSHRTIRIWSPSAFWVWHHNRGANL